MKKLYSNKLYIALFIAPALILFLGVMIVPIFETFYYSFFDSQLLKDGPFIGFNNYKTLFASATSSKSIIPALKNSLILAALSVFIQLPLSLGLALLIGKGRKGERVFLSIYFVPVVISTVIVAQLWAMIYKPTDGLLDYILRSLGSEKKIVWLVDYALPAVLVPTLWQYVGYHMLLLYAGIKGVPTEYREAAMIDGAKEGQINRYIVLPYIKPIMKICVIFAVTGSLKSYDLIKILAGTNTKTKVLSTEMIKWLLQANKLGLGSAIATIMIVLCFAFALIIGRIFKEKED